MANILIVEELPEEIRRRLKDYCDTVDEPDFYSGRFEIFVEFYVPWVKVLSDKSLDDMMFGLYPPSRGPSDAFKVKIIDNRRNNMVILEFYYCKEKCRWIFENLNKPIA